MNFQLRSAIRIPTGLQKESQISRLWSKDVSEKKDNASVFVFVPSFAYLVRMAERSRDGIKSRDGLSVCRKSAGHAAIRQELVSPVQIDKAHSR